MPAQLYETGLQQRTLVIEFDSVEKARAARDSPAYQEALAVVAGGAERDIRIVGGCEGRCHGFRRPGRLSFVT